MSGVNNVTLLGFLGEAPEFRSTPDRKYSCYLMLVTSSRVQDVAGAWKTANQWHRVALFDDLAVRAFQTLRRGSQVYIEGSLKTCKWVDTQTNAVSYFSEIVGEKLEPIGVADQQFSAMPSRRQRDVRAETAGHSSGQFVFQPDRVDDAAIEVMLKTGAMAWQDAGSSGLWVADFRS